MPGKLLKYLPNISQDERDALYSSITTVTTYARGTEIREGAISGKIVFITAHMHLWLTFPFQLTEMS